jgi:hypothetical protein
MYQTAAAIWDEMEMQFHLIPDSSSCLTYTVAVYAVSELLMMDGKAVRNM